MSATTFFYGDCAYYGYVGRTKDNEHPWWSRVAAYSVTGSDLFPNLGLAPQATSRSLPANFPGYSYMTANCNRFKANATESYCGPHHVSRVYPAWPPNHVLLDQGLNVPVPPDTMLCYGSVASVSLLAKPGYMEIPLSPTEQDPRKSYEEFPYNEASGSPVTYNASVPNKYIDIRGPT